MVCGGWGVICAADLLCDLADPRGGAVGKVRPSGAPPHRGLNTLVGGDSCRDTVRQPRVTQQAAFVTCVVFKLGLKTEG